MNSILNKFKTALIVGSFLIGTPFARAFTDIPNLSLLKKQLVDYYDSRSYLTEVEDVINRAKITLMEEVKRNTKHEKLALVLDIDETSISNYSDLKSINFGGDDATIYKLLSKGDEPPLEATKSLYLLALKNNFSVFFITGRSSTLKAATEQVLKKDGYGTWAGLYFKSDEFQKNTTVEYKSAVRKKITEKGFTIVANIGDQYSDLKGGFSLHQYKLPNPFYYLP